MIFYSAHFYYKISIIDKIHYISLYFSDPILSTQDLSFNFSMRLIIQPARSNLPNVAEFADS